MSLRSSTEGGKSCPSLLVLTDPYLLNCFLTYIINIETKQDYKVYCNLTTNIVENMISYYLHKYQLIDDNQIFFCFSLSTTFHFFSLL